MKTATFGAGCFWGIELTFARTDGVVETAVGYAGGNLENPTYENVCGGRSGHAEVVQVRFDEQAIDYRALLDVFWGCHDPTTLNRQGPDVGSQYRSVIFCHDQEQRQMAEASRDGLEKAGVFGAPIVTEISTVPIFYLAEDYHQKYLEKRGRGACHAP
ncbi:MAG: peptide-methionine (S)-S-oxide reductase MsrA [Alphaproteobacteria bacterium]